ncbi:MAG: MoaD/ThiS family protein [Thermodesulfobacteriota bacterium]
MAVKITCVGTLLRSVPGGGAEIAGEGLTVREALESLVKSYGTTVESELMDKGEYRKGLSFLLNGRNVLSLPEKHDTKLFDGDELMIAAILSGG